MWDAPNWLGTAIRAKIDKQIAAENRASTEDIAAKNRQSNEDIASANRRTNELIAAENRRSNEYIAELNRTSNESIASLNRAMDESIATARNDVTRYGIDVGASTAAAQRLLEREMTSLRLESNERIAANELSSREGIAAADRLSREHINSENIAANMYIEEKRRELTASEGAKSRDLTASEGEKNRLNQMNIAKLQVVQRTVSDGVRFVPYLLNTSDFKFNGGGSPPVASTKVATEVTETKESAKSKADSLFPELEPTFSSSINDALPTIRKSSGVAAIGALLVSAFSGMSSFVPFI